MTRLIDPDWLEKQNSVKLSSWIPLSDEKVNQIHKEHHIYKPTIRKIESKIKEVNGYA